MKLHLGCGNLKLADYINIDIDSEKADMKLDITNLGIFNDKCVDEIYNCHVLEHVPRRQLLKLLLEWNRILKIGGTLRIAVPDFEQVVSKYNETKDLSILIGFVNGGQTTKWDFHYINFDFNMLAKVLHVCGFDNVMRYDPHKFLGDGDDYSKAYIPHMDPNGTLMSLNIVCTKSQDVESPNVPDCIKRYLKIK